MTNVLHIQLDPSDSSLVVEAVIDGELAQLTTTTDATAKLLFTTLCGVLQQHNRVILALNYVVEEDVITIVGGDGPFARVSVR
jgi:hypothetical protein